MCKGMLINTEARGQVDMLTDEEAGQLFKALLGYACTGTHIATDNRLLMVVFEGMRAQIDTATERYNSKCERNRQIALDRERRKREDAEARTCTNVHERAQACTNVTKKENNNNIILLDNNKDKEKEEEKKEVSGAGAPHLPLDLKALAVYFNDQVFNAGSIIKPVRSIERQRAQAVSARCREYGKEAVRDVVRKAVMSDFLNGKNDRAWVASFDWLMKPNNFQKVLEGNYDNGSARPTSKKGNNIDDNKKINQLWDEN